MIALAKEDPRIVDVEADLTGAHGMKPFKAAYPDRSFNVGIAEANMVGVAAGLSACGKIPFVHSFATFASRRCFDQIAISVCYAGLNVKIVGSDPGVGAELNGGTHMALEDMGIMRTLPGMTVFEPTDSVQPARPCPPSSSMRARCTSGCSAVRPKTSLTMTTSLISARPISCATVPT
ncbi:MAG: transketolase family protein [Bilophila wadsworthia]